MLGMPYLLLSSVGFFIYRAKKIGSVGEGEAAKKIGSGREGEAGEAPAEPLSTLRQ